MLSLFGFTGNAAQDTTEIAQPAQKSNKSNLLSVQALRMAATRLADLRADGASLNTRELVGLLVCNAQRSRRIGLPDASIRLMTNIHSQRIAIRLKLR